MESHKRYLARAAIPFEDGDRQRVDFHALRHTFGSMLAKARLGPRVAMSPMRHAHVRLTMNVHIEARVLDRVGAVEKLPSLDPAAAAQGL